MRDGVINIQGMMKLSLLDFPGKVACTVFTGGCNLRCPFCHNSSLVRTPGAGANMIDEVLSYLEKRKGIIEGVCITGGEPLLQPHLPEFIRTVSDMGFAVKLDTNGALPERLSQILSEKHVDYVAMDIKGSPEKYGQATDSDIPFETFMRSISVIRELAPDYEFRTTAVKGLHTVGDFEKISLILRPDEKYFIQKYADSGDILKKENDFSAFSDAEMKEILETVRKQIPACACRG